MGNNNGTGLIPGVVTWYSDAGDYTECSECEITLMCELVGCFGKQKYAFMKQALGTETVTVNTKIKADVGPGGPSAGIELGGSVSVVKGDWLVTYFRKGGHKHMCTNCFRDRFPKEFAGALLSAVGKAKVINSQCEWIKMSYGTME